MPVKTRWDEPLISLILDANRNYKGCFRTRHFDDGWYNLFFILLNFAYNCFFVPVESEKIFFYFISGNNEILQTR